MLRVEHFYLNLYESTKHFGVDIRYVLGTIGCTLYLCDQQPNRKVKNEIDHILINNTRLVRDISILSMFMFPSDYRIEKRSLRIQNSAKYKGHMKGNKSKKLITPVYKVGKTEYSLRINLKENKTIREGK